LNGGKRGANASLLNTALSNSTAPKSNAGFARLTGWLNNEIVAGAFCVKQQMRFV
jgi:hypothetical protein